MKGSRYELITIALKSQDLCNTELNGPDWRTKERAWHRAIWTESAEAMGYINWEWWKNVSNGSFRSTLDMRHFYMELADILAFGLSLTLNDCDTEEVELDELVMGIAAKWTMVDMADVAPTHDELLSTLENIPRTALEWGSFDCQSLFSVAAATSLTVEGLFCYYIGKDVLNKFRKSQGYQEGKYIKNWGTVQNPREDNEFLIEVIERFRGMYKDSPGRLVDQITGGNFQAHVKSSLAIDYGSVLDRTVAH